MRPAHLKEPKSLWIRLKLRVLAALLGQDEPPEPVYLFLARPAFMRATAKVMGDMDSRGSHWSVGARELMSTHVSARFQCPF